MPLPTLSRPVLCCLLALLSGCGTIWGFDELRPKEHAPDAEAPGDASPEGEAAVEADSSVSPDGETDAAAEDTSVEDASLDEGAAETGASDDGGDAPIDVGSGDASDAATNADGGCGDTQSSEENCGRCNHGCLGGGCEAGKCKPVVLLDGRDYMMGIAVDDTQVYATQQGANRVLRLSKNGAVLSDLADGNTLAPTQIVAAPDGYYWTSASNLYGAIARCPLTGCSSSQAIVENLDKPAGLAIAGDLIFWTERGSGAVKRAKRVDGTDVQVLVPPDAYAEPYRLAVSGGSVLFTDRGVPGLLRVGIDGGPVDTLAPTADPMYVAVANATVYWTAGNMLTGAVYSLPVGSTPDGGAAPAAITGQAAPFGIAADNHDIYWINGGSDQVANGAVLSCPLSGCPGNGPLRIVEGLAAPVGIALDATSIYVTVSGLGPVAFDGRVLRIAKP